MTRVFTILLLTISSLASAQQPLTSLPLKSLTIGWLIYIGEDPAGDTSFFALHLGETRFAKPINLASPITFQTIKVAVVAASGSLGPIVGTGPYVTPTEILINDTILPPINGHLCPCLAAMVQLVMSSDPTVTISLKNGESITTSSLVNVYLEAPHGLSAIQLQQYVPIVVHALP